MTATTTTSIGKSPILNKHQFTVYFGTFVHPTDLKTLEIVIKGAIGVDESGTIVFINKSATSPEDALLKAGISSEKYNDIQIVSNMNSTASFFFPGFFDTHIVSNNNKRERQKKFFLTLYIN